MTATEIRLSSCSYSILHPTRYFTNIHRSLLKITMEHRDLINDTRVHLE